MAWEFFPGSRCPIDWHDAFLFRFFISASNPCEAEQVMNPSAVPQSGLFAVKNQEFEKSQTNIESIEHKKVFLGSYLVTPVKNAARYVVSGMCRLFRNIRSFLITAFSPCCSCFRKGEGASSGQDSSSSVEGGAGRARCDISSEEAGAHGQVSQGAADLTSLLNRVKVVSDPQGITGFIKSQGCNRPPYGVVNSIDRSGKLLRGAGCAIKKLAGDDYALKTREKQKSSERLGYGQCATYDLHSGQLNKPSGLDNKWRTIYNVLVPPAQDQGFAMQVASSLLAVIDEAVRCGTARVILPMLGCVRLDATGEQLALALFAAVRTFESRHPSRQLPEIILVGTDSSGVDKQACMAFERKWEELKNQTTAAPSRPDW